MSKNYIKGKGVLVGTFSEEDITNKTDKTAVEKAKEETGYKYTNEEFVKKAGKIVGLKIYVCTLEDMKI